jgi:hypothetical protein
MTEISVVFAIGLAVGFAVGYMPFVRLFPSDIVTPQ